MSNLQVKLAQAFANTCMHPRTSPSGGWTGMETRHFMDAASRLEQEMKKCGLIVMEGKIVENS